MTNRTLNTAGIIVLAIVAAGAVLGGSLSAISSLASLTNTPSIPQDPDETSFMLPLSSFPSPTDALTTALLRDKTHVILTPVDKGMRTDLFGGTAAGEIGFPASPFVVPEGAFFTLLIADAGAQWEALLEAVNPDRAAVLRGTVEQYVAEAIGDDVSVRYDLLPLAEQPATLSLFHQSGGIVFLLHGESDDRKERDRILEELHVSFRNARPGVRITERVLDDRYPSKDIRIDDATVTEKTEEWDGWTIRRTGHEEQGDELLSATKGASFLVGNNTAAVHAAVQDAGQTLFLSTLDDIRAGGWVDMDALPGETFIEPSAVLPQLTGSILWSLEQNGPMTTVTVMEQKMPIP